MKWLLVGSIAEELAKVKEMDWTLGDYLGLFAIIGLVCFLFAWGVLKTGRKKKFDQPEASKENPINVSNTYYQ